jgi:hypothetical protein
MLDVEMRLVPLMDAIARSRYQLVMGGGVPEVVELRFGEGALADTDPRVVEALSKMQKVFGLPLRFPEEHGTTPLLLEIVVRPADPLGGHRAFINPQELTPN